MICAQDSPSTLHLLLKKYIIKNAHFIGTLLECGEMHTIYSLPCTADRQHEKNKINSIYEKLLRT
jgi:hypothetical protein